MIPQILQLVIKGALVAAMVAGCIAPVIKPVTDAPPTTSTAEVTTPTSISPTPIPVSVTITPTVAPSVQSAMPKAGHWEGELSSSFDVTSDGHISNFQITLPLALDKCVFKVPDIVIRADNTFVISDTIKSESGENLLINYIDGKFEEPTVLRGIYGKGRLVCKMSDDRYMVGFFGEDTSNRWRAEWKRP